MAQVPDGEQQEGYVHEPWDFRASLTPRKTYSSKSAIVYKRRPRPFRKKDVERILIKALPNIYDNTEFPRNLWPWYWKIINTVAEEMIQRLGGLVGFSDEGSRTFWYGINTLWDMLLTKIFPGDPYYQTIKNLFMDEFMRGLDQLDKQDKTTLLEGLLKKLRG